MSDLSEQEKKLSAEQAAAYADILCCLGSLFHYGGEVNMLQLAVFMNLLQKADEDVLDRLHEFTLGLSENTEQEKKALKELFGGMNYDAKKAVIQLSVIKMIR